MDDYTEIKKKKKKKKKEIKQKIQMDRLSKIMKNCLEEKFLFKSNFPSTGTGTWVSSERITQILKYERE